MSSENKSVGEKSLQNLIPYKPGQSGNPSGRPAFTPEERMMRDNFKKAFAMIGNKSIAEIQELAKDPSQPAPIALAAKALEWAFKKGNPAMYREIFDRTIGKVTQTIEVKQRPFENLSDDELALQLKEAEQNELKGS